MEISCLFQVLFKLFQEALTHSPYHLELFLVGLNLEKINLVKQCKFHFDNLILKRNEAEILRLDTKTMHLFIYHLYYTFFPLGMSAWNTKALWFNNKYCCVIVNDVISYSL